MTGTGGSRRRPEAITEVGVTIPEWISRGMVVRLLFMPFLSEVVVGGA